MSEGEIPLEIFSEIHKATLEWISERNPGRIPRGISEVNLVESLSMNLLRNFWKKYAEPRPKENCLDKFLQEFL